MRDYFVAYACDGEPLNQIHQSVPRAASHDRMVPFRREKMLNGPGTHIFEDELRRISSGPRVDEGAPGMGTVRFVAYCPGCASLVNERVRSFGLLISISFAIKLRPLGACLTVPIQPGELRCVRVYLAFRSEQGDGVCLREKMIILHLIRNWFARAS